MFIFIILFGIVLGIIRSFVYGLISCNSAVYSILTMGIVISIAIMFLHSPKSKYCGTIGLVAIILCFVAYDMVASYSLEVVRLITFVISFVVTFFIKRAMWRFVRADAIRAANGGTCYLTRPWMKWLFWLI